MTCGHFCLVDSPQNLGFLLNIGFFWTSELLSAYVWPRFKYFAYNSRRKLGQTSYSLFSGLKELCKTNHPNGCSGDSIDLSRA
jgi:hypothetical protein